MKNNTAQQEILLMTGTSFSLRNWCEKDPADGTHLSAEEMLKEACWSGLLPDMLPEICNANHNDKKLFLWAIREGGAFIDVEMGEVEEEKEPLFSINPYSFLDVQVLS